MSFMRRYRSLPLAPIKSPQRRRILQAGTAILCLGRSAFSYGAEVLAVRMWPAQEYTRVTLESNEALKWSQQTLQNPDRLLVDIEGLELSPTLRDLVAKVNPNDPYIQQVRVGQNRPHVVRLVFDLKEPVLPQVFTLAPIGGYQNRLVFDLYPTQPIDPIVQMARAHEAMMQSQAKDGSQVATQDATSEVGTTIENAEDPIAALARQMNEASTSPAPSSASNDPNVLLGSNTIPPSHSATPPVTKSESTPNPNKPRPSTSKPNRATAQAPRKPKPSNAAPKMQRLLTIMIDPGHGGEDPGATGPAGTREKDVVLSIAKKLHRKIIAQENMQASMTRDADYFVPLQNRVTKARQISADLFISIHADAFTQANARGASVFALSDRGASSAAARWLANNENAADLIGGVNVKASDKQVAGVLLDLSTTAQIHDSKQFGAAVLGQISGFQTLHKKGVEQAGFAVLKAPDIPSILIETAFISNPEEEVKLNDDAHQERLADAILRGIQEYFAKHPPLAKRGMV